MRRRRRVSLSGVEQPAPCGAAPAGAGPVSRPQPRNGDSPAVLAVHHAPANGAPAVLFVLGGQVVGAVTFDLTDSRIAVVRGIAGPTRSPGFWPWCEQDTPLITHW